MSLDQFVAAVDKAFGPEPPCPAEADAGRTAVFEAWLQDQVSRQIIRDYLANALRLQLLDETALDEYWPLLGVPERRSLLSLHMLMNAVEDAPLLPAEVYGADLMPLEEATAPVQLELVRG